MSMAELRRDARFAAGIVARRPFQVLVQVTNRCNATCSFCDFWPNGAHPREELTTDDFRKLSDELATVGTFLVSIEGGEPFVRTDLVEIVRAFGAHHVPLLYTNGWFVTEEKVRALFAAGLAQVGVSIDYPEAARHDAKRGLRGGTERAWQAVDLFRRYAPHGSRQVHVMTVLMRDNQYDLEALLKQSAAHDVGHCLTLLSTQGFRRGKQTPDNVPDVGMTEQLLSLWKQYPHFRMFRDYLQSVDAFLQDRSQLPACQAGTQSFNIDHLGNVSPCIEKIDRRYGNVRDEPLTTILERMRAGGTARGCQDCWTLCRGFNQSLGQGGTVKGWLDLGSRMRSS
jgi:MoaA/NifB/PqqE/SkfB family radical SAM enzyme